MENVTYKFNEGDKVFCTEEGLGYSYYQGKILTVGQPIEYAGSPAYYIDQAIFLESEIAAAPEGS